MLQLNLIPQTEKKKIVTEQFFALVKREAIYVLILLCVVSVIFNFTIYKLESKLNELEALLTQSKNVNVPLVKQVWQFNDQISRFEGIQSEFVYTSLIFEKFVTLVPSDIHIKFFSVDKNFNVVITGAYEKRQVLLSFKDELAETFLNDIEFPLSNLLAQENGIFTIKGVIK